MSIDSLQLIVLVVTAIGVVVALLGYVSNQSKNLRDVISSGDKATSDGANRQRHDLENRFQMTWGMMRADIETLKREAVRKDEVAAMDNRWSGNFVRLEAKLDRVAEQLSQVAALEVSIRACSAQLGSVAKRLDAREGRIL
ncbi:MAG: hypothetical protein ACRYGM_01255 [Janthinobacterium lividum]